MLRTLCMVWNRGHDVMVFFHIAVKLTQNLIKKTTLPYCTIHYNCVGCLDYFLLCSLKKILQRRQYFPTAGDVKSRKSHRWTHRHRAGRQTFAHADTHRHLDIYPQSQINLCESIRQCCLTVSLMSLHAFDWIKLTFVSKLFLFLSCNALSQFSARILIFFLEIHI